MPEHWYSLYGLTLQSDIPLHAPSAPPGDTDLRIRSGAPREVPPQPATGELLCRFEYAGGGSAHVRTPSMHVLRYYGTAEFEMTADLAQVTAHADPRCAPSMVSELLIASVPAFQLLLSGRVVLHASAVARDGKALAMLAHSGGGKSTLAAALCAQGCIPLTDDVLTLEWRDDIPHVLPGPGEIRLRPGSATQIPPLPHSRQTVDGRLAVSTHPEGTQQRPTTPLAALVVAEIDNAVRHAALTRLDADPALAAILAHLRTVGWKDTPALSRIFGEQVRLAKVVPAYRLTLPWGPSGLAEASGLLMKLL